MSSSTASRAFVTEVGVLLADRRREITLVASLLLGGFALASLVGSVPTDPTLFQPGSGRVENPCGPVGAHLAFLLRAALGVGAWALVVPMGVGVLSLAGRRTWSKGRWVAAAVLATSLLALLQLGLGPAQPYHPGGLLGHGVVSALRAGLGGLGAGIFLLSAIVVSTTVLGRIPWGEVAESLVIRLEFWAPRAAGVLLDLTHRVLALTGRTAKGGAVLVGRGVTGIARTSGGALGRMGSSLARGVRGGDDWDYEDLPDGNTVALPDDGTGWGVQQSDNDTVVGHAAALVEVEWEPTELDGAEGAFAEADDHDVLGLFPDFAPREAHIPPPALEDPEDAPRSLGLRARVDLPRAVESPRIEVTRPMPVATVAPAPEADDLDDEDDLDEDDLDADEDTEDEEAVVAPPSEARTESRAPGLGLKVHHADFLDQRVEDDGQALVRNPRRKGAGKPFELPPLSLLDEVPEQNASFDEVLLRSLAEIVEEKLASFRIGGRVTAVRPGPVVTIFEFEPEAGIKVSKIASLSDDLAMALKAVRVRIVAPIPGKGCVGIEIPSERRLTIYLREILASDDFRSSKAHLQCILGKDVSGRPVVSDLAKMPHLLIGGTTGSGKSVGVNGMLMSLLFTMSPDDMRMLLIDPKMLEFELYDGIPHLLHPVITDAKSAAAALNWACKEMDRRYSVLARWGTRNIVSYNKKVDREVDDGWNVAKARKYFGDGWMETLDLPWPERMPYIVVIIDELADLMMQSKKEVEESVVRLAQKARACGIHLIVATQRPSTDVITGLIKANLPTRISFQLRTGIDSRTILDQMGAESLLGRGDMLYLPPGVGSLQRCHGAFVSDEEVARVTDFLRMQQSPVYIQSVTEENEGLQFDESEKDDLYDEALQVVRDAGKASTSMIQRHLKIGYNRAARIIDIMEAAGVVGPADGARPRDVL